ncbi:hypothetical protein HY256_07860 [Candidatus Sumerlaeota bacterium]|nr:hypothetical protein [Candidatus Sumerlaeota bacterium]
MRPFYFTKAEEAGLGNIPWLGIGNLRVRVKEGTGQPLANAWVELISRGGNPPAQPTMQTDGNGDALWSDLPEGNYSLRLPVYNRIADALVQNGKTAEVPIMLGSYKLTSTVNYRGAPLQGAYVVLNSGVPGQQITGQTDVSGNVKFEGLAEGNYAVSVVWPEGFFSSQGIQYDPFSAPPQNIALRGEQQPDAIPNLVFNMPTGVISGAVSEDYIPTPENPPPYIELYLISQPTVRMNTHPDSLGFFFLPGLPAGQYRIEFTSDKSVGTYDYTLGEGQEISGIVLPQK